MKISQSRNSEFAYKRKLKIGLGDYGELIYVWRGSSPHKLLESSVSFRTLVNGKWYTIRRHCWTLHQDRFHTHVRIGFGKRRFKKVYPSLVKVSIIKALNWSKHDMMNNWYIYLKSFEKLLKIEGRNK